MLLTVTDGSGEVEISSCHFPDLIIISEWQSTTHHGIENNTTAWMQD